MTDAIQKAREALEAARESLTWGYESASALAMIDAALAALDAETPATPADVGELVERLRHHAAVFGDYEGVMRQWDLWRAMIAKGHRGSLPRDAFESLIDGLDKDTADAATALERVVRERDEARATLDEVCLSSRQEWQRATDAEAKLAEARKVQKAKDEQYWSAIEQCSDLETTATRLTAENATLRARLETVEAETRERCAKVAQDAADEYDALINAGKGEHCKPGYVTDAVWHSWAGKYSALSAIAARLRNLEPRHD